MEYAADAAWNISRDVHFYLSNGEKMDIKRIADASVAFNLMLSAKKKELPPPNFGWYPYGTLENFHLLNNLLTGTNRNLLDLAGADPIVDIGAADGESAFFIESLGHDVHVVDYSPTNFNGCRGVRLLKEALGSRIKIHEVDLDSKFDLPCQRYGLALFLGILYHLKNPFGALESLARNARYAIVSTRIAKFNVSAQFSLGSEVNRLRAEIESIPAAYLVAPTETNNDSTNYWIFTDAGLKRIVDRCGWDVLDYMTVGNTNDSDPATNAGDERAFCLLRSRNFD